MMGNPDNVPHQRSDDRVFVLAPVEGKITKNTQGLLDARLFTGENKLHAVRDPQNSLWFLKYDAGNVPPPLRQQFTSFKTLENFVRNYFTNRNVEVKQIID